MTEAEYNDLVAQLKAHGHQFFKVVFRRRTDKKVNGVLVARKGDLREMVCRMNVTKRIKGVDPDRHTRNVNNRVITVFEMAGEDSGYKSIPVDSIVSVSKAENVQEAW